MALRVTQSQIYSSFRQGSNYTLGKYMESSLQSSTQKKVNRPSDNPIGAGDLVSTRSTVERYNQYDSNIKTAMGWLSASEAALSDPNSSIQKVLSDIQTLATQGSSGTYNKENRHSIGDSMRQLFDQLINFANTAYGGKYVFAGHKTNTPPFQAALSVNAKGVALSEGNFTVEGSADKSVIVQATSSGDASSASYRYSDDAGKTWKAATVEYPLQDPYPQNSMRINAGGVSVVMDTVVNGSNVQVTAVDPSNDKITNNGTWLDVYPTAIYKGDDNDNKVVTPYGSTITGTASGKFSRDVAVKIDSIENGIINYSFSTDDGSNWTSATTKDNGKDTRVPVPGGFLNLEGSPSAGQQYIIHPRRASIDLSISDSDQMTVNMVGKDVFGGIYKDPDNKKWALPVNNGGNMFEIVGKLVGYAELNDQDGMAEMLPKLEEAMKVVLSHATQIGGKKNRLAFSHEMLEELKTGEENLRSSIEDVDVVELMTRLTQEKTAYTSVLQSSSMIMQTSLLNYL